MHQTEGSCDFDARQQERGTMHVLLLALTVLGAVALTGLAVLGVIVLMRRAG